MEEKKIEIITKNSDGLFNKTTVEIYVLDYIIIS